MSKKIIVKNKEIPMYHILIESDFNNLSAALQKFSIKNRRICIVTESNVGPLYSSTVQNIVKDIAKEVIIFEFESGESNKNLTTVQSLYSVLIEAKFDRNDMLIALGGGVVGDLTGYTAATYLRGISYIQIPTSLLAQVDSSIGGKTGVDFECYKNMVGAFYQPKLVYINLSTLTTLSKRQFLSGMGEIIKYGLIKDKSYYDWLTQNAENIIDLDMDILEEMVYQSCCIKRKVVENDPKELGERVLLNFGHTFGHAIEKLVNFTLLHGECVAIGMGGAAFLSYKKEMISKDDYEDILRVLSIFQLPITFSGPSAADVVDDTQLDKKMDSGNIKFILLESIGKAIIDKSITTNDMLQAVNILKENA